MALFTTRGNEPSQQHTALSLRQANAIERKTFQHSFMTYLKDSNAYTNIYFARYFEWQGVCRELWFHECVSDNLLALDGAFVTKQAHQDYVHEVFPMQNVTALLNTYNLKPCSFFLLIRFFVEQTLVSGGYQQVVFQNRQKKVARLPKFIAEKVREYEYVEGRVRPYSVK